MRRSGASPVRVRGSRAWPARATLAVAIALGLLIAACGSAATHHSSPRRPATLARDTTGNRALAPVSVSFISGATGWLLGTPTCARTAHPCRTLLLRKTTDGGRTWSVLPALPVPGPDWRQPVPGTRAVSQILFAGATVGWAYGPGLWVTRDGGRRWRQAGIHGQQVQGLAYAGGRVIAAAGPCRPDARACHFSVYSAPAGSNDWQLIARASQTRWQPPAAVVAAGRTGYVFTTTADLGPPVLLAGPLDGSAPWHPVLNPCRHAWSLAVAGAPGGWLFLGCGSEPGAGNQLKTAYLSHDGGRSWHTVPSPPSGGYLGSASMTPSGTIFLSGGRMDVVISPDRGRTWHTSPSLDNAAGLAGAGFTLVAATTTSTAGIAYQDGVYQNQVWLTRDRGRVWTAVTVR